MAHEHSTGLFSFGIVREFQLELEQAVDQRLDHIILHISVDPSIHFGKAAYISGVVLQHGVYCVRVALMGFHNGFIREESTHGDTPAFPHGAAARHDVDAAQ